MSSPLTPDTAGDFERDRRSRLVTATRWAEAHPGLSEEMREAIAGWINTGGRPPWSDEEPTGGQTYPPTQPKDGPRA